ncbi:Dabb family protein [Kiritimatiellaeota bacterium B1221]|nr:Dabb family protein [Kiritimatiellaeota bacterium B1221]
MITHIVQWKVKDQDADLDKKGILEKIKNLLEELPAEIPEIISLQAGINEKPSDAASDIVLLSTFAGWQDLEAYQVHPAHVAVGAYLKTVVTERRVVDFED